MKTIIAFIVLAGTVQAEVIHHAKAGQRISASGIVPPPIVQRQKAGQPLRYNGPPIRSQESRVEWKQPVESRPVRSVIPERYAIPRLPKLNRNVPMGQSNQRRTMRGSTSSMESTRD